MKDGMRKVPLKNAIIASLVMIATAIGTGPLGRVRDVAIKKPLSEFPMKVGDWTGKRGSFDQKIYDVLGVDDSVLADYRNLAGDNVNLYVGFYESQREGDIIHSPKNCMPGAGWNVIQTRLEDIDVPGNDVGQFRAIELVLQKGESRSIVLYWFQSRGRIISSEYYQKIYLVLDSIFKGRTDGSFVRLIAPVMDGDEKAALANLKEFAVLIVPKLREYLPS